jgi:cold shock CspA family protein
MEVSPDGWVKLSDVLATKIMEGAPEDKVLAMIEASNEQKLRYELRETEGVQMIRAVTKVRGATATTAEVTESSATDFSLRQDAPAFVPNAVRFQAQLASATAAMMSPLPGYPPFAAPYPWPGLGGFSGFPFMVPGMPPLAATERYQGRIKSFNTEKGFGFIESAGAHAQFGRDVFVHRTVIGSFGVGSEVTFTVETNKQGMPQAKHLVDAQHLAFTGGKDSRKGKGKGGGQGKGAGRKGTKKGEKEEEGQTQVAGGTAAETAQDAPQEASQEAPQEASQEPPQEASQEPPQESPHETSQDAPQEAAQAAPQDGAAAEIVADLSAVAVAEASPALEAVAE